LRIEALNAKKRWHTSTVRGLMGGRIMLFPHQLYLSHNLEHRHRIRVLLADEVGLGKTIEAGLILHRSLLSGRVERVLILVPPALTYAWFAELYLRFNLCFRVLDDTMVEEIITGCGIQLQEIHLLICPKDRLTELPLLEEDWDMLIIDEAHHYQPNTEDFSQLQAFCKAIPHVLMLSATPDQDGSQAHFMRLKCLDSENFDDPNTQQEQMQHAKLAAKLVQNLQHQKLNSTLLKKAKALLKPWKPEQGWEAFSKSCDVESNLTQRLMDRHALGRLMIRNTRKGIGGFPKRIPHLLFLTESDSKKHQKEFFQNQSLETEFKLAHYEKDERLKVLVQLSETHPGDKILVLCHHRLKTEAIVRALDSLCNLKIAKFHEGMTLMDRDRQAAWFQEPEGPSILVSSPLGAEGRNFQMAKHLYLFDQPLMPEALEQWIGRLDRIGQGNEVHLYVPVIEDSLQHRLYQCHQKLGVYQQAYRGSQHTHGKLLSSLLDNLQLESSIFQIWLAELDQKNKTIMHDLEQSRDILLEMISYNEKQAQKLVESVETMDDNSELENWMELAWDHHSIESKKIRRQTYHLQAGDGYANPFPGFKEGGMAITFDRIRALKHDDVTFLTWDHPMVRSSLDMVISGSMGNSSVTKVYHSKVGIIVEAIFVVYNTLPAKYRADRFFPLEPIHLAMDRDLVDISRQTLDQLIFYTTEPNAILSNPKVRDSLHTILQALKRKAELQIPNLIVQAKQSMAQVYDEAIAHMRYLKQINPTFNNHELLAFEQERQLLDQGLEQVILKLDALRLIACFPKK